MLTDQSLVLLQYGWYEWTLADLTAMVIDIWVLRVLHNCTVEVSKSFRLLTKLHLQTSTFNQRVWPNLHETESCQWVQQHSWVLEITSQTHTADYYYKLFSSINILLSNYVMKDNNKTMLPYRQADRQLEKSPLNPAPSGCWGSTI